MHSAGARLSGDGARRLSDLWQLPLVMLALGLSLAAAYLFVDAKPALAFAKKLAVARQFLHDERPEAATQSLLRIAAAEKLPKDFEAKLHLLMAESLDAAQKQSPAAAAANYQRVIEESQIAIAQGVKPTAEMHRRMGECYEALGKPADAASQYRQAMAIDPALGLRLQRKVINLQVAASDWAAVEHSLDAYLTTSGVSDAERAWAQNQKAQLLIDRGEFLSARRLLEDALRLDNDAMAQAQTKFRLGLCARKTGKVDEATALITAARTTFNGQHPLDAAAAVALGSIAQEKGDFAKAGELFDAALAAKPDAVTALRARLSRASVRLQKHEDDAAIADLRDCVDAALLAPQALRSQTIESMRSAAKTLASRENFQAAVELLTFERTLDANVGADLHSRMADACEKRADQVERSAAEANGAERVRRAQIAREYRGKAAEANLACAKALAAANDKNYAKPLWKAADLLDALGDRQALASALELWVHEREDDAIAPDVLARLGATYEAAGQNDAAIGAYARLQSAHANSPAATRTAVALSKLYVAKGEANWPAAMKVLATASAASDPDERRVATIELARLQIKAGQDVVAIESLTKFLSQFASDAQCGEANVIMAECHARLAASTASDAAHANQLAQAVAAKKEHLEKAAACYDKAMELYRVSPPTSDDGKRLQKLAAVRRADCAYDLGDYASAVKFYEQSSRELTDGPQAVAANIQIANAYFALHKPDEARAAAERAKTLLQKLPSGNAAVPMPAAYWEQWLKWTGSGGTW